MISNVFWHLCSFGSIQGYALKALKRIEGFAFCIESNEVASPNTRCGINWMLSTLFSGKESKQFWWHHYRGLLHSMILKAVFIWIVEIWLGENGFAGYPDFIRTGFLLLSGQIWAQLLTDSRILHLVMLPWESSGILLLWVFWYENDCACFFPSGILEWFPSISIVSNFAVRHNFCFPLKWFTFYLCVNYCFSW